MVTTWSSCWIGYSYLGMNFTALLLFSLICIVKNSNHLEWNNNFIDFYIIYRTGNATESGCKKISSCHAFTKSPNNAKIINFIEWSETFFSRISDDSRVTDELLISRKSNHSAKNKNEDQRTIDKSNRSNFYKVSRGHKTLRISKISKCLERVNEKFYWIHKSIHFLGFVTTNSKYL